MNAPQAKNNCPIKDAILFVSRPNIRPLIRQELKEIGVKNVLNAVSPEACIELLSRNAWALLVIDYEHGSQIVNSVLRQAQSSLKVETRPIFLLTSEINPSIMATGAEYFVSRILAGEVSRSALHGHLEAIMVDEWDAMQCRPHLNRVASARLRQDYNTATAILRDLHEKMPKDVRLVCELADSLIQQGAWADAKSMLDKLGGARSDNLRTKHLYARCLMREGRHEEAVPILRSTRIINPHNVERLIDLGLALMHCDKLAEANESFNSALALDRDNSDALKGKAECSLMEGDVNEALNLLRQVSGPRELASIFNSAAILSIRAGRFDTGFNLYHSALRALGESEPAIASVLFNLGVAYHKKNQAVEALECFEKAYAMDGQFDKARHNAVIMATKLGRNPSATIVANGQTTAAKNFEEFEDEVLN